MKQIFFSGRKKRWVWVTLVAIAAAMVIWAVRYTTQPAVYFVSETSFRSYRAAKIPDEVVDRIAPITGKYFLSKSEMRAALRAQTGDGDFQRYEATLVSQVRSRACWPNTSPQPVYLPHDSRANPAYARLGIERVIPQSKLPAVPTQLEFLSNGNGILVLGKFGHLIWFGSDNQPRMATQIPGVYSGGDDEGALGLAVDPNFNANHFIYVAYVSEKGDWDILQRLTLQTDPAALLASRVDVIRFPKDNREKFHGIGSLHFDRTGMLMVQVGDPTDHSQSWGDYQGKLLGLVPGLGPEGGYTAPGSAWDRLRSRIQFGSPLILAKGFRSPFSGTLWRGFLIVGDVGGNGPYSEEEINIVAGRGQNFGWGVCEDPHLHADFTPPTIVYRRGDPSAAQDDPQALPVGTRSVIVGAVYEGAAQDRYEGILQGRLLYSDFFLGFVRGARLNDRAEVEDDVFLMHLPFMTSMRLAPDGYIYGLTAFGDNGLFRVILKSPRRDR